MVRVTKGVKVGVEHQLMDLTNILTREKPVPTGPSSLSGLNICNGIFSLKLASRREIYGAHLNVVLRSLPEL
jgi:hypothetical protein